MPLTPKLPLDAAHAEARPCCAPVPVSCADTPAGENAPAGVQKRRSAKRRVSPLADRQFLNEFKALSGVANYHAPAASDVPAIVSMGMGYAPSDPLPSYLTKTPRHWRDATDEVQGFFAFQALTGAGPVVGFTVWCSPEIDAKARATGKPLPWLHKRLKEALDDELGPVQWMASLEEEKTADGTLLLHVHGAGAFGNLTRSRRRGIRKAMRSALGSWDGRASRYQCKLKIARDDGWASYMTKRCWLALPGVRKRFACDRPGSQWRLSFDGPAFTMTNSVRARAKELHQQAREIVIEARGLAKASAGTQSAPETETPAPEFPRLPRGALAAQEEPEGLAPAPRACTWEPETIRSRSRDPPGSGASVSAGPDPPLPERRLVGQVAEHELTALAVAQRDDG
ncbi:hypothetical protein PMNALOAF_3168 [Methylobacterium adhaesivum]|nr:hypothetical protein PMNALOAF_3168 [Methylobacterium adhaesivum]